MLAEKIGRFKLEAFDPVSSRPTIKITAFNLNVQDAR